MLRRIAAGAGRRGQWHLMLADILSQINGRKHATTQVAPNLAYSDPEMAEIALQHRTQAKHKVTRPEIKVGALSLEGVSQMDSILPERLPALVRPAFDLVLRRIRSLNRWRVAAK